VAPKDYAADLASAEAAAQSFDGQSSTESMAYFEVDGAVKRISTPVYVLGDVPLAAKIAGPAIIVDSTQTIVVEPGTTAFCLAEHVILRVPQSLPATDAVMPQPNGHGAFTSLKNAASSLLPSAAPAKSDPIMLAVFANRFMSIAEQMGHTLQRTSISVSIKERLDFSCSIHGTDGALVANAPHIPVHLGSMQYAVQAQHEHWKGKLRPGDVLLTNHPQWGGEPLE
jgi:5-oxoprolinase (ATP-hydrolysing)